MKENGRERCSSVAVEVWSRKVRWRTQWIEWETKQGPDWRWVPGVQQSASRQDWLNQSSFRPQQASNLFLLLSTT